MNSFSNRLSALKISGFLTVLVFGQFSANAFAKPSFELTALGGLNYAAPTQRTLGIDIHTTGNATATFGLLAAIPLFGSNFEFETGVMSISHQTERDNVYPLLVQRLKTIQIPFLIRYNLDEAIGLGAGVYTAFAQGNVETTQNGFTTETPYETLQLNKTDVGLILNVRARIAIAPPLFFILDGRYQHGLTNQAMMVNDLLNTRSIQMMAGLTYRFEASSASPNRIDYND